MNTTPMNGTRHSTAGDASRLQRAWDASKGFPTEIELALVDAVGPLTPRLRFDDARTMIVPGAKSQVELFVQAETLNGAGVSIVVMEDTGKRMHPTIAEWVAQAESEGDRESRALQAAFTHSTIMEYPAGSEQDSPFEPLALALGAIHLASRLRSDHAVLLVHSLVDESPGFCDFQKFGRNLDLDVERNRIVPVERGRTAGWTDPRLFVGWIEADPRQG